MGPAFYRDNAGRRPAPIYTVIMDDAVKVYEGQDRNAAYREFNQLFNAGGIVTLNVDGNVIRESLCAGMSFS